MKYVIRRTSNLGSKKKPCKEAKFEPIEHWHIDKCDEDTWNKRYGRDGNLWRDRGKNHSVTKEGHIIRQLEDEKVWIVEFNSLEELLEFSKKYGDLVFQPSYYDPSYGDIEIYDDYRE